MRTRLRQDLTTAMKARDTRAVAVLRSALAAIENAEAVAPQASVVATSGPIAGATLGAGTAEAQRKHVDDEDVRSLLRAERDERLAAASELDGHGQGARAEELRTEADVLARYLD